MIYDRVVSLSLCRRVTKADMHDVIQVVRQIVTTGRRQDDDHY